ncbi:MAG: hypothetical protein AABP62_10055 [Planctomycetota bacterium]
MKSRLLNAVVRRLFLPALLVLSQAAVDDPAGIAVGQEAAAKLPAWVTMPDKEFCSTYYNEATGNQEQRSLFAWRLFARLNQQVRDPAPGGKEVFSAWELWISDPNTFPPAGSQSPRKGPRVTQTPKMQISGQEVTRNALAYDYIVKGKLYQAAAVQQLLGTPTPKNSPRMDMPVGSVEIKAQWVTESASNPLPTDMYIIEGLDNKNYGLQALHIMAKIKTYPDGPRPIDDPSWFWTTFEYYNNPDRKYLIDFITYQDTLKYADQKALLAQAGLGKSQFSKEVDVPVFNSQTGVTTTVKGNNYLCNGTQYTFVGTDPKTKNEVNVILGNSILEGEFTVPSPPGSKNKFRGWNASCHTCHYEASGNKLSLPQTFHSVTGNITLGSSDGEKLFPADFEWSIPFNALQPAKSGK